METSVRFFGVRGSIATPGATTAKVGGNTSCSLVTMSESSIILDGGTGLRALGAWHGPEPMEAVILFSHLHWDHIQGVPFFTPLYNPDSSFIFYGPRGLKQALERQMALPNFPVSMEAMVARVSFISVAPGDSFNVGKVSVSTTALNHPGGSICYRMESAGTCIVHALDHEHGTPLTDQKLGEMAEGVDLLIYDAQYLPEEYESKKGWGHSTYAEGAKLARNRGVGKLVLAHHDPSRDDRGVLAIEQAARRIHAESWVARETCQFVDEDSTEIRNDQVLLTDYLSQALA